MSTIPKRPRANKEMILAAANVVVAGMDDPVSPELIVENYRHPMDGYELAKQLFPREDISREDMERLDEIENLVDDAAKAAEEKWFTDNSIAPPLPIGATTTKGVIAGIYEYGFARYRIKETGCKQDGRYLVVKFEDAVEA